MAHVVEQGHATEHEHAIELEAIEAARYALESSGRLPLKRVQVEQFGESILLSGKVSSYYLKQLAQETLRELIDSWGLINEIEVDPSSDH